MTFPIFVHTSNRLEELYRQFIKKNFPGPHPLARRIVVVPSPMMRSWLMERMAQEDGFEIAMGVEICYLSEALQKIQGEREGFFPSSFELALAIQTELGEDLYPSKLSGKKKEKERAHLSLELAPLFQKYGVYGEAMVNEWRKKSGKWGWQETLFVRLLEKHPEWKLPFESLSRPPEQGKGIVSLFGLNFFAEIYHHFFARLSAQREVSYYFLSPTPLYWGDMESDAELRGVRRRLSEKEEEEFEDFLTLRHPLIANWGKLGRKMFRILNEEGVWDDSGFVEPTRETLLGALQGDLFDLNVERAPLPSDESLQIHEASDKFREVEIVKGAILSLAKEKKIPLGEILVMAPDIGEYVPYIQAVFREVEWRIFDRKGTTNRPLFSSFLSLLSLVESHFSASEVLSFIQTPPVARRLRLGEGEFALLEEWVRKGEIRWGIDGKDRKRVVEEELTIPFPAREGVGTWEHGFQRLFDHLLSPEDGAISLTDGPTLGTLIETIRSLREDLAPLREGGKETLSYWGKYLRCLYEAYFDAKGEEEEEKIFSLFERLERNSSEEPFSWPSLSPHIRQLLEEPPVHSKEGNVEAIRFCSMLPMRAIPGEVVVLMGMTDENFPKKNGRSPLDLLPSHPRNSYSPSPADFDRYLFLESILSARKALIFSYLASSEIGPSSLLSGLIGYVRDQYGVENLVRKHPLHPFDCRYFLPGTPFKNFDRLSYQMAQIEQEKENWKDGWRFSPSVKPTKISISTLRNAWKNPMKNFLEYSLGIFLEEEETIEDKDRFSPPPLALWKMRQELVRGRQTEEQGGMVKSLLQEHLLAELQEEGEELREYFQEIGAGKIVEVELSPTESLEGKRTLPPIKVGGVEIVGNLGFVSEQGILLPIKNTPEERFRAWPELVLFAHLTGKKQGISLKSRKTFPIECADPAAILEKIVEFTLMTMANPLPMDTSALYSLYKGGSCEPSESQKAHLLWFTERYGEEFDPSPIAALLQEVMHEET